MNRAYVQRRPDKLVCPSNTAADGLAKLGYEVVWFDQEEADKLDLSPDTLVVGFIDVCRNALKKITGKDVPVYNYPDELTGFLEREVGFGPLGSIRNDPESWPVFVKPKGDVKIFSGRVIRSAVDLIATKGMTDDEEVWVSEVVEFKSEFRCFIQHGQVIGCRHYKGDPLVFPNPKIIQKMVETWKTRLPRTAWMLAYSTVSRWKSELMRRSGNPEILRITWS